MAVNWEASALVCLFTVIVTHGRDATCSYGLIAFLEARGDRPREWLTAVEQTRGLCSGSFLNLIQTICLSCWLLFKERDQR